MLTKRSHKTGSDRLAEVARKGKRGILFLPNHPGFIDPVIIVSRLLGPFGTRALADENEVDRFFIRWLAKRIHVLPIPDMTIAGADTSAIVRSVVVKCVKAL